MTKSQRITLKLQFLAHFLIFNFYFKAPVPALPKRFSTNIEINFINEKRTDDLKIFFDYDKAKCAIEYKENNQIIKHIYDYDTSEVYEIIGIALFVKSYTV